MKNFIQRISLMLCVIHFNSIQSQNSNHGLMSISSNTKVVSIEDFKNDSTGQVLNDGDFHLLHRITNDGDFEYSQNLTSGTVYFDGNWQQIISGNGEYLFNNLEFDNYSDSVLLLNSEIQINGFTNFYSGIISVEENASCRFTSEAEHDFSSEFSHIDGFFYKVGSNSFRFPCGNNSDFRPASISSSSFITDEFRCEFISENSDSEYPHENKSSSTLGIDNSGYWEIWRTNGNSEVIVGLSYSPLTTSSLITENLEKVHALRWDEISQNWVSEGGVLSASENMIYTAVELDEYGIFTLGLVEETEDDITAYNLVSPNFNGQNDFFRLDGIEKYADNEVTIVNRWGETVFEIEGYDNNERSFKGFANSGITSSKNPLPDGTYFYVVIYNFVNGTPQRKVGFLEIYNN